MSNTVNRNLKLIDDKLTQLEKLRGIVNEQVSNAGNDYMKRMAFAELLKSLLEIDKTILAYIKESNTITMKVERQEYIDSGERLEGNPFLNKLTSDLEEAQERAEELARI